jgi:F-type H+-transporting ATPase subunit delta
LAALKALFSSLNQLPAPVSGTFAARQLEAMMRNAVVKTGFAKGGAKAAGLEQAIRFILLLVKKGCFPQSGRVVQEIESILNRRQGILMVRLEAASPPDAAFEEDLKAMLCEKTGAVEVVIENRIVPELLGGYRLLIGDESWDASLREQLRSLARTLGADSA